MDGRGSGRRDPDARLAEGVGLARAIDLIVTHAEVINLAKPHPATLFGSGTVDRLSHLIAAEGEKTGDLLIVVVDSTLSPVQQRNLERAWNCKVIDRTGLILEIFGERARTREGRLQVELAALSYQRGRLVRSWTHLERQRGGAGFMGGPGETQIETDRRLIDQRIAHLKRQLDDVKRTRALHREARRRVPYPIIAMVGYTNAGKSTLFNYLTKADVAARDQLFATLDPTMRGLELPSGRTVILSDTVGFISGLPHELVNAFHATLEEVLEADIILHIRDISHPDTEAQKLDVLSVLDELGLGDEIEQLVIEVLNKIDLLEDKQRQVVANRAERSNVPVIPLSALTGDGTAILVDAVDDRIAAGCRTIDGTLGYGGGATLAWLYDHGDVVERRDEADAVHLTVRLDAKNAARFLHRSH